MHNGRDMAKPEKNSEHIFEEACLLFHSNSYPTSPQKLDETNIIHAEHCMESLTRVKVRVRKKWKKCT